MLVCLCYGVSEKKIKELVSSGATTVHDLQTRCNAGKSCGRCVCELQGILKGNEEQKTGEGHS